MYFVPIGLFVKSDANWVNSSAGLPDLSQLTLGSFVLDNLVPVTIGNVLGGALMVGAVYWFIYLRPATGSRRAERTAKTHEQPHSAPRSP
jgi:formate/nitrite transporter FocA (FNT family)